MTSDEITARLEYLRGELRAERISWGELAELESLSEHIDSGDVELREAAGVPEHPPIDSETIVELADGCSLRSDSSDDAFTSGEYVRLCDPAGKEIAYWHNDEWATDPVLVMGAIINSAAGLRVEG